MRDCQHCNRFHLTLGDLEDPLLMAEGVAKALLAIAEHRSDQAVLFHFLGSSLSDYCEEIREVFNRCHDEVTDPMVPTTATAEAVTP
jgi:hypothetical protein